MDHLKNADDDDGGRRAKNELNRLFKLSVCLSVYPLSGWMPQFSIENLILSPRYPKPIRVK